MRTNSSFFNLDVKDVLFVVNAGLYIFPKLTGEILSILILLFANIESNVIKNSCLKFKNYLHFLIKLVKIFYSYADNSFHSKLALCG